MRARAPQQEDERGLRCWLDAVFDVTGCSRCDSMLSVAGPCQKSVRACLLARHRLLTGANDTGFYLSHVIVLSIDWKRAILHHYPERHPHQIVNGQTWAGLSPALARGCFLPLSHHKKEPVPWR